MQRYKRINKFDKNNKKFMCKISNFIFDTTDRIT